MVPCVDDTCSDMFAFRCCLLDARSFANIDSKLSLGPRTNFSSRYCIHEDMLDAEYE